LRILGRLKPSFAVVALAESVLNYFVLSSPVPRPVPMPSGSAAFLRLAAV
jgi:hypothetical protein